MDAIQQWGIGIAVTVAIAAFVRFVPKQKMMSVVGSFMFNLGKTISKFGNSKIGKKSMDKIEEGVFNTLIAVILHGFTKLGDGLKADNK